VQTTGLNTDIAKLKVFRAPSVTAHTGVGNEQETRHHDTNNNVTALIYICPKCHGNTEEEKNYTSGEFKSFTKTTKNQAGL
jgi:hypothetical protein